MIKNVVSNLNVHNDSKVYSSIFKSIKEERLFILNLLFPHLLGCIWNCHDLQCFWPLQIVESSHLHPIFSICRLLGYCRMKDLQDYKQVFFSKKITMKYLRFFQLQFVVGNCLFLSEFLIYRYTVRQLPIFYFPFTIVKVFFSKVPFVASFFKTIFAICRIVQNLYGIFKELSKYERVTIEIMSGCILSL